MYRHSLLDSFKLKVYLSPLLQTLQEKQTNKKTKNTSITEHLQFPWNWSCLSKFKQRLLFILHKRVTVVFWNVLFTGIPLLVHIVTPWMRLEIKTKKKSFLNSSTLWGKVCILYIFCPISPILVEGTECQERNFLFSEASTPVAERNAEV